MEKEKNRHDEKEGNHEKKKKKTTYFDHQESNPRSAQMSEQFFHLIHKLLKLHTEKKKKKRY